MKQGKRFLQRTIHHPAECTGVGLHSGRPVTMKFKPAPPDHGIVFSSRNGNGKRHAVKAEPFSVTGCDHNTTLGDGVWQIRTVEHLMATFHALGVDNVEVEVKGPEIPIMDGSAAPFIHLLHLAGIKDQPVPKRFIRVLKTVSVEEDGRSASLQPSPNPKISFTLHFPHPAMGWQNRTFELTTSSFAREIAAARTFGFLGELEALQDRGLALGASMENAVAMDSYRVLNREGLRFADEFVRHKILDAIGDLYLAGVPILGHYSGYKAGHLLNYRLVTALLSDTTAWEEVQEAELPAAVGA